MNQLAFLFPGQGSQYVGMGRDLLNRYRIAQLTFEEAEDTLGFDLRALCLEGNPNELTRTENAQPALLALGVAAYRVFMEELAIEPTLAAGHSLGEFTALACAGAIEFGDTLRLVRKRGQFMQQAAAEGTGAMCAIIGLDCTTILEACQLETDIEQQVVISNLNAPRQTVISGHREAVTRAAQQLERKGARISYLNVSAPFHSPLMKPAADQLASELNKVKYGNLKWPVLSNVTGIPYIGSNQIIASLTEQMTATVQWDASMRYLVAQGIHAAVELGPRRVLTDLLHVNVKGIECLPFEALRDMNEAVSKLKVISGYCEPTDPVNNVVTRTLAAAVCTRNLNWDEREYRIGVIEPYRRIQAIQDELDAEGRLPSEEEMLLSLTLLKQIMQTKKVPEDEQQERIQEIVCKTSAHALFPAYA
ncbi:ACP S-malonyltransferase [Paenibacillus sp. SYP-B3998]|uniref:[acyl-carrier-protein] S-malonyltransferase n=1 Tax=Paenibacillus sp. SYP-B3998 TaxID=2678564 RepID=A0A6G3ZX80_9BACL|nr:ACP S-malonyltransferase [Paenibacillus sp. SYP-B3998]NEW06742.1 ACP S-malonyltransferase [Paenibacillus sp. SYP-B3998]